LATPAIAANRATAAGEHSGPVALRGMKQRLGSDRSSALVLVAAMIAVMWALEAIDYVAPGQPLDNYGIHPRDVGGLPEIVSAPFLHVGFGHLISNTVPFAIMAVAIALGGLARVVLVTAIVALVSGLGVWLIAPSNEVHLGASGLVFGYAAYLVTRGILSRRLTELAIGVLVVGLFGIGLLQGVLPQDGISWQAHLFGAIGGVVAAYYLAGRSEPAAAEAAPA
jgi:membrane associated rhomboid family serine protease